jgi:hypothetical protein
LIGGEKIKNQGRAKKSAAFFIAVNRRVGGVRFADGARALTRFKALMPENVEAASMPRSEIRTSAEAFCPFTI